ncbi:MAG TPA: LamG domain-containing protein [Kiritimatiellia bacterium]|nr:LamG domain-containing protein [Kiritimatiellia bacterium]HRZ12638.1 LamG domain-containing protein [Kiritimatiellia bacterium]HSA19594.1 LamG domain-containing protein [Kiritimatiellia bacterium]
MVGKKRAAFSNVWKTGCAWLSVLALPAAGAQTPQLTAEFLNPWSVPAPGGLYSNYYVNGVGAPAFGGSTLTNILTAPDGSSSTVTYRSPSTGLVLAFSQYGQPVESDVAQYDLGDVIPWPAGMVSTSAPPVGFEAVRVGNNTNAYYQITNPVGAVIYLPSTRQVVAAAGGNVEIGWLTTGGVVRTVYTISAVPAERPARVFWTEPPYNAPAVNLSANGQQVFACIHYNNYVTRPVMEAVTTQNAQGEWVVTTQLVSGVWLDGEGVAQKIRAMDVEGIALLEYYADGTFTRSIDLQPIQVMPPTVNIIEADIGSRLLPTDHYYGVDDLIPRIMAGAGDDGRVLKVGLDGPKENWVFAIRRTVEDPWDVEIFWEHQDDRGVVWPFEVDWYALDWPDHATRYVLGEALTNTAPIFLPDSLAAALPNEEPAGIASVAVDGRSFSATAPGHILVQYSTHDNMWFDVLRAVRHDDRTEYDPTPQLWDIGREILPFADDNYVLYFDGTNEYVEATMDAGFHGQDGFTVEAWAYRSGRIMNKDGPLVSHTASEGFAGSNDWEIAYGWGSDVYFWTHAGTASWSMSGTADLNQWHHFAGVYDGTNVLLYVDGVLRASTAASTALGVANRPLMIGHSVRQNAYFQGKIDEVRIWNTARRAAQISDHMYRSIQGPEDDLAACYPLDEGAGTHIRDAVDGSYGQFHGTPQWSASFHLANTNVSELAEFPGYIYSGRAYNVNRYHYPDEDDPGRASYIFAVNTNDFEIWWARPSSQTDLPSQVYYPSLAVHYHATWPTNAPQIVIAGGRGSGDDVLSAPSIYYQNDGALPGYNPNEEHALVLGGKAYALRDDLNRTNSSQPFVLVDGLDPQTARPTMRTYGVVRTNADYRFEYSVKAGSAIIPPMPLSAMPPCSNTTYAWGPAWEDRKESWWAKAAGNDGGDTNAGMRFFYQVQPSFWFPALGAGSQPALGREVPWLPTNSPPLQGGSYGTPLAMRYDISWPADRPEMQIAQTLTLATRGLPDIWNQLSVDVIYQQSRTNGHGDSVSLFDPMVEHAVDLDISVINAMVSAGLARKDLTSSRYILSGLAPSLRSRMYYDPDRGESGQLVLGGEYRTTLTGGGYLLPNLLDTQDREDAMTMADPLAGDKKTAWVSAVNALPTNITLIVPNVPYVKAALCSALSAQSNAVGYVTLVFNNSTNAQQVPPSLPVSLSIIKVVPELYNAFLDVIESDDALDEKLSLRYAADYAGRAEEYDFDWRWAEPEGGLPPTTNYAGWSVYGAGIVQGELGVNIEGSSPFTLADHYFAVRYKRHDGLGPTGTNWSEWSYNLAPGWIQRVMNAINPYEQRLHDMIGNSPNLMLSMIGQAGPPYEGAVALNDDAVNSAGLIQIYQTVLDRAISMSLDAGMDDTANNDALLFAASRLNDLYMLLGNEAFADAQDPTIGFGTDSTWFEHYGAAWSSLFCFMNQFPTLLDEELGLLRGRDDTLEPSTELTPVFNRLIWNYTRGISGGEVAYAMSYNIKGDPTSTVGVVTAEDAKALYPQGHGDAWGHYACALAGFYRLLSNTNFGWNTTPGATLVGNAAVSSDFFDEQKFAEAAAAKARTGAEIVSRTYRKHYTHATGGRRSFCGDSQTNRAWGVDGWASRAGQGAYLDWVAGNSLLLDNLTNLVQVGGGDQPPEGIQRIDRTTVPELDDIAANLEQIQKQLDHADLGLSPLGLDRDVVPFDISAAEIDAGQTHFEQIYARALGALDNAAAAFDYAQGCTEKLREQWDSVSDFTGAAAESEVDYHDRLLEIFGYPYPDDIGPGKTYPQGYAGPDLVNYQILDLEDLLGVAPTGGAQEVVTMYRVTFTADNNRHDYTYTTNFFTNTTLYVNDKGLKVKPPSWTGRRPAQGDIQSALSDFVKAYYGFLKARDEYANKMAGLSFAYEHFRDTASRLSNEWLVATQVADKKKTLAGWMAALEILAELSEIGSSYGENMAKAVEKALPDIEMQAFPPSVNVSVSIAKAAAEAGNSTVKFWWEVATHGIKSFAALGKVLGENAVIDLELGTATNALSSEILWGSREVEEKLREQTVVADELMAQIEEMCAAEQQYLAVLKKGERLISERARFRARTAQRLQADRYADMAFRIFRDEALAKYSATFDLAARYCYLAAKAYDYETGLLGTDTERSPGSLFLSDIVKSRSLGRMQDGTPLAAGTEGDPGLADAMARMKADWDVVKGRLGFNTPDTETSRFSLRTELFRTSPSTSSDETWRNTLELKRVDNLYDLPEFQEYCIPFSSTTNREPAIVIPFSSYVLSGHNFFGKNLAGGDNAYDPTHFTTKIRSVGIWFTGYNVSFNTNLVTGGGLANEPRVYLVPAGQDIMRSPTRGSETWRTWRVFDQALPLPFDIGRAELDDPDWIPLFDSLGGTLAQRRRHASLRAYHDRGQFDASETCSNARLVGRSVWNTRWLLIIPGRTLLSDANEAIERFIYGAKLADGTRDGNGIKDIKIFFQTYSIAGE